MTVKEKRGSLENDTKRIMVEEKEWEGEREERERERQRE
jgi:hypothetical protein